MCILRKLIPAILSLALLAVGQIRAEAAVIYAQLVDENPNIIGSAYVDGVLVQNMVLGEESYDGRFTGFILFDDARLTADISESINIYNGSNTMLIGTLSFGGGMGTNFVHTSYFSWSRGAELEPLGFPTMILVTDGTFATVLDFIADNGDQYVFQYKNVPAEIPEPSTAALCLSSLLGLLLTHRRSKCRLIGPLGNSAFNRRLLRGRDMM